MCCDELEGAWTMASRSVSSERWTIVQPESFRHVARGLVLGADALKISRVPCHQSVNEEIDRVPLFS